jgi:fibronectin type 3 domain-containing protein
MLMASIVLAGCGATDTEQQPGNSSSSGGVAPPVVPDTTAPTTPSGLTASAESSSQISLAWAPSTDNVAVTGYRVYQNGVLLAATGNVTTYLVTGLAAFTTYTYRIDALDASGNASGLSAPASASTLASNTATLEWDPVAGAIGYRVYYGVTQGGPYFQASGGGIDVGKATTYTVTGLAGRTRYYFVATAFSATAESAYSNEVSKDLP